MQITWKNNLYDVVADGNDVTLQSVQQNVTFYGAYAELQKQAHKAFLEEFPYGPHDMPEDFLSEYVDRKVEKYLDSIAIMGEVKVHNNN